MYVDIGESIDKSKKIKVIVDYFMSKYYDYGIDVMCLQGIQSYSILREIITEFKERVNECDSMYLEYYPDIKPIKDEYNWSTTNVHETVVYDKLTITRHRILNSGTCSLDLSDGDNVYGYDKIKLSRVLPTIPLIDTHVNASESDYIYDGYKYAQIINLNVDGTYVSIYNIELKHDVKGIRNHRERKRQLDMLRDHINTNKLLSAKIQSRIFKYGDHKLVSHYRDIHIVTGMFHINEMRNDDINQEYVKMIKTLQCVDTHRWDRMFRQKKKRHYSNIRFTKDSYTLMITTSDIHADNQVNSNIKDNTVTKSEKLFEQYHTLIANSSIMVNSVDMNYFTNYPLDTLLMIYQPQIGTHENNTNNHTNDHFIRKHVDRIINDNKHIRYMGDLNSTTQVFDTNNIYNENVVYKNNIHKDNIHKDNIHKDNTSDIDDYSEYDGIDDAVNGLRDIRLNAID
jgi:hypothetical protein